MSNLNSKDIISNLNYGDVVDITHIVGTELSVDEIVDVKPIKFDGISSKYTVCKPQDADYTLLIYKDVEDTYRYLMIDVSCKDTYLLADAIRE